MSNWQHTVTHPQLAFRCRHNRTEVPHVVFIHGGPGDNCAYFKECCGNYLEERYNMVWFDQRGCGKSQRPLDHTDYSIVDQAEDIGRIQSSIGARQIILLAHSWGNIPASIYAATYPDKVRGLINISGSVSYIDGQTSLLNHLKSFHKKNAAALSELSKIEMMEYGFFRLIQLYRFARNAGLYYKDYAKTKEEVGVYLKKAVDSGEYCPESVEESEDALFAPCKYHSLATYELFGVLEDIKCPTLVISGAYDKVIDTNSAQKFCSLVKNSQLVVFEESGHHPFQEEPLKFQNVVSEFINSISIA